MGREFAAPVLARGCGTSLPGETVNYAVVIGFSKYLHQIFEVDPQRRTVLSADDSSKTPRTAPEAGVGSPPAPSPPAAGLSPTEPA